MAFVVEDGTGLSTANSYVSVADFKSYWTDRNVTYTELDPEIKGWLINATQYIDLNYTFKGEVSDSDQALQFPRKYICDKNGNELASDKVPLQVVYATCELGAINKTNKDLYEQNNVKSEKLGPVSVTYKDGVNNESYPVVTNYLKGLIKGSNSLTVNRV